MIDTSRVVVTQHAVDRWRERIVREEGAHAAILECLAACVELKRSGQSVWLVNLARDVVFLVDLRPWARGRHYHLVTCYPFEPLREAAGALWRTGKR